jgi:subtilisin family serine protease
MIGAKLNQPPGDGVIVGMFDSGFRLNHKCFNYVKAHQAIIADSDFVDHRRGVSDPDSVRRVYHELGQSPPEEHGSWVLSLIAGIDSGNFAGAAWGAKFVLAKTEWADRVLITPGKSGNDTTIVEIEIHAEEDNWASAMVWAESLGVDIVSSSLGYSNGFTDSLGNLIPRDDYTYADMNGSTTIISKAAQEAAARGMIIVNAMGNEGPDSGTMDAPADVKDVISVGGINPDKSIASFSSRGPTSDGRTKPDCVAQATEIYVPDIYSSDSAGYEYGLAGTSFSTPVVAGICALIRQTHQNDSAALLRERLYASCVFAPTQMAANDTFGRGVPNALVACLSSASVLPGAAQFVLYPNVLDIGHNSNQFITVKFIAAPDVPVNSSQALTATVRTMSGRLVWSHCETCVENQPVSLKWPQSSKVYAPGMYYFVLTYRGNSYSKKFLILG